MTRHELSRVSVAPEATLRDVLAVIDSSALAVALLVDPDQHLVGLLTDGDVRRALLGGAGLTAPARPFATATPQTVSAGSGRAKVLDLMRALRIAAVPEVDDQGRLVGLHTLSDVIGVEPLPNPAVIMAGGRGTRLGGLTRNTPKPLMEVADRSILEWIVLNLVGGGIRDIQVSVNHLADQIEEHLGDGSRLGCRVTYLREDPDLPLGTAGSLALFRAARPDLTVPTLVLNGDLMFRFEPERLLDFHEQSGAAVSVATRPYQHEVPFGVVETDQDDALGAKVTSIREKPTFSLDVNAGVYAVSPDALDLVQLGVPSTMPDLIQACLDAGSRVVAWPLRSDWIDVGTPFDLARAKGHL
jgi:dTDP-glucose pyrophosphorylase